MSRQSVQQLRGAAEQRVASLHHGAGQVQAAVHQHEAHPAAARLLPPGAGGCPGLQLVADVPGEAAHGPDLLPGAQRGQQTVQRAHHLPHLHLQLLGQTSPLTSGCRLHFAFVKM